MGQPQQPKLIRFGLFEVEPDAGELRTQGRKIALQEQPLRVLVLLLNQAGKVVTREDLRQHLWPGDTFVDFDKSLNTAISKLREALGDEPGTPRFIETVPRHGYRFIADVTTVDERPQEQGSSEAESQKESRRTQLSTRLFPFSSVVVALAAGVVLLTAAGYEARYIFEHRNTPAAESASIAVLPFADLSPERDQEYFCDGFVDELISALSKLAGLRVMARDTAISLKGKIYDIRTAGRELGVTAILTGSMRKSGDNVRITAELLNTRDGSYLWANTYERSLYDVFAIQEEVSAAIIDVLRVKLAASAKRPLRKQYGENSAAHLLYLKGRYFRNKNTKEGLEKAIACFEEAIGLDPGYAPALVGLADTYFMLGILYFLPPHESMLKAKQAVLRAVQIDDALGEAHTLLGNLHFYYDWDWSGAEREYKRGIDLNPGDARGHWFYGAYLAEQGRVEESLEQMKWAMAADPLSADTVMKAGFPFFTGRRYEQALEKFQKAMELNPHLWYGHWWIGQAYLRMSRFDDAIRAFEQVKAITGRTPLVLAELGRVYARLGNGTESRRLLQEAEQLMEHADGYVSTIEVAFVYADLGDNDRAMEWLGKAYRERHYALTWLKVWPGLDPLRSDHRFTELLHKLQLD